MIVDSIDELFQHKNLKERTEVSARAVVFTSPLSRINIIVNPNVFDFNYLRSIMGLWQTSANGDYFGLEGPQALNCSKFANISESIRLISGSVLVEHLLSIINRA